MVGGPHRLVPGSIGPLPSRGQAGRYSLPIQSWRSRKPLDGSPLEKMAYAIFRGRARSRLRFFL